MTVHSAPSNVPLDNVEKLREFVRRKAAAAKRGIIEVNILRREGQPVAYYITKVTYMNLSGYRYTGRCILPFDGGWPPRKDEKRIKGWFKDPYNKKFDSSANYSETDRPQYDSVFPQHSLSRLRREFPTIVESLVIPDSAP